MEKWKGKYALVTGASTGIGAAIAKELLKHGVNVIGCGRHQRKLEEFRQELSGPGQFIPMRCDIAQEMEIMTMMQHIKAQYTTVDILINNAGINTGGSLLHGSTDDWAVVMDINVIGTSVVTRETIKMMTEAKVEHGYIININSILGKTVKPVAEMHMYAASKHALNAITQGLRNEIREEGLPITITQIFTDITSAKRISRLWSAEEENHGGDTSFDMSFTSIPGACNSPGTSPSSPGTSPLSPVGGITSEDVSDRVIRLLSEPIKQQIADITLESPNRLRLRSSPFNGLK